MNASGIEITDILGSNKIHINIPMILLKNVPSWYLFPADKEDNVYWIDVDKLHNDLEKMVQYIYEFMPIGQIRLQNTRNKKFTILMANTKIIPTTRTFERVDDKDWVALIRKNDKTNRSVGTIRSVEKPSVNMPVFPRSFFQKVNPDNQDYLIYDDLYSHEDYGRWALNKYAFNIDRTNLKMIDSMGEISNMFIPMTPMDMHDDIQTNDGNFNRKVYFTTQGSIVADTNCVPPRETLNKLTINECNGTYVGKPDIAANDEGMLAFNETMGSQSDRFDGSGKGRSKWFKKGKTVVLKEKDEPWFLDADIVGDVLYTSDPHKVTGSVNLIGTNYGDEDEISMPTNSGCVTDDLIIGYSMADKRDKCFGIERFGDDDSNDPYDTCENGSNYNNTIMLIICVMIIVLLLYRRN